MFKTIQTYLLYTPSSRSIDKELEWIKNARENAQKTQQSADDSLRKKITDIALTLYTEYPKGKEYDDIFFSGAFSPNDSINNPELRRLIKLGSEIMARSTDPAHELGHVLRTVRFAKLLYCKLIPNYPDLDWGIIATALVFHDSSRAKNVGFLYNSSSKWRRMLRNFPLLIDLSIFVVYKQDSPISSLLFFKKSRGCISKTLRRKIAISILGEHTLKNLQEKLYPGISLYKDIIFCADNLDLISLGRVCGSYQKTITGNSVDLRWYNRLFVLNLLFNLAKMPHKPEFSMARKMYNIVETLTYCCARDLSPKDAMVLKNSLLKGGWCESEKI